MQRRSSRHELTANVLTKTVQNAVKSFVDSWVPRTERRRRELQEAEELRDPDEKTLKRAVEAQVLSAIVEFHRLQEGDSAQWTVTEWHKVLQSCEKVAMQFRGILKEPSLLWSLRQYYQQDFACRGDESRDDHASVLRESRAQLKNDIEGVERLCLAFEAIAQENENHLVEEQAEQKRRTGNTDPSWRNLLSEALDVWENTLCQPSPTLGSRDQLSQEFKIFFAQIYRIAGGDKSISERSFNEKLRTYREERSRRFSRL
jgi:hypothetical protein